jgi:hypothetical protein
VLPPQCRPHCSGGAHWWAVMIIRRSECLYNDLGTVGMLLTSSLTTQLLLRSYLTMPTKSPSGRVSSRHTARAAGNNSSKYQRLASTNVYLDKTPDPSYSTYGEPYLCRCEERLPNGMPPEYSEKKTEIKFELCVCHVDGEPLFVHLYPTIVLIHIFRTT